MRGIDESRAKRTTDYNKENNRYDISRDENIAYRANYVQINANFSLDFRLPSSSWKSLVSRDNGSDRAR